MPLDAWTIALLTVASFLAAFFDAIVGGGGLITIPALLAALPATTPIPTVLGTNKVVAGIGTTVAASRFLRRGIVSWREVISPVVASMFGAAIGVQLSYLLDPKILRPLILVMLCGMLLFTIFKPTLGQAQQPRLNKTATNVAATGIAFILGLYDGFFGPGTGSLLIFLFVAILGFDFLRASAMAKSVNWASNISSIIIFVWRGSWLWQVALPMAAANALGGWIGAHMAITRGSAWIRKLFILIVAALIARLVWQTL